MTDGAADLDDLHWHWGEAYLIHHLGPDTWVAQRRDSRQTLGAENPETLRERIKADYAARPVSRRVAGAGRPQEPGRWRSLLIAGVSRERQGSEPVLHRVRPEYDEYGPGASARHSREDAVREHGRPDQDSGVSGGIGVSRRSGADIADLSPGGSPVHRIGCSLAFPGLAPEVACRRFRLGRSCNMPGSSPRPNTP